MAKINISAPPSGSDPDALARWLMHLIDELEYVLSNLDEDNMTAAYNLKHLNP